MSSSQQQSVILNASDDDYVLTPLKIQSVKVARIDRMQNRFPELKKTKENVFARTRIDFPPPAHVITQSSDNIISPASKALVCPSDNKAAQYSGDQSYIFYNRYIDDDEVVLLDIVRNPKDEENAIGFLRAGPRRMIPSFPQPIRAAIVCSGSLCPGQNDVIAEVYNCLYYNYGVDTIYGIYGGFRGFYSAEYQPWQVLTPDLINNITGKGGSLLGSNKGGFHLESIVNACRVYCVNQLYLIGGDGSHLASTLIDEYCKNNGIMLQSMCIPSSVENDLAVIDSSFGFGSALSGAVDAIQSAVVESKCIPNGVGIVSVTGKHSGYLACHSVLASNNVCACLIPESKFALYGPNGLLEYIYRVVNRIGYAVIVVAEGVAKDLLQEEPSANESGIGIQDIDYSNILSPSEWIKEEIDRYFKAKRNPATIRIISATTSCRSAQATASDRVHCLSLSNNAVHAAMSGYTAFTSAIVNNRSVLVPCSIISNLSPSYLSLNGRTYERVRTFTQQPVWDCYDIGTVDSATAFARKRKQMQAKL